MKISEQITKEFFTLEKLIEGGFSITPVTGSKNMVIEITNLQTFLKSIHDKIQELESNH